MSQMLLHRLKKKNYSTRSTQAYNTFVEMPPQQTTEGSDSRNAGTQNQTSLIKCIPTD